MRLLRKLTVVIKLAAGGYLRDASVYEDHTLLVAKLGCVMK